MPLNREGIVKRAARELADGYYVNLGIGMPTLVANHLPPGMEVVFHSENGFVGMGAPVPGCSGGGGIEARSAATLYHRVGSASSDSR